MQRHDLPARPGRPLRLGVTADDGRRRARPGHRAEPGQRLTVGPAVPTDAGLPRRAALDIAVADAAHSHGEQAGPGHLLHHRAQNWPQLVAIFGEQEARALFGLINVLVMFGGSKDVAFNREISDLTGTVRVARTSWQSGHKGGRTTSGEDIPILRPEEIRQLPERHALVIAENGKPIIARLTRCVDGKSGKRLLANQKHLGPSWATPAAWSSPPKRGPPRRTPKPSDAA